MSTERSALTRFPAADGTVFLCRKDAVMRSAVGFLILCLANATAFAQAVDPPKSAEQIKDIEGRVPIGATCLRLGRCHPYVEAGMARHMRTSGHRAPTIPLQDPGSSQWAARAGEATESRIPWRSRVPRASPAP
jgi:hypothetical protein